MKSKETYVKELTALIEKIKSQIDAIEKLMPVMKSLDGKDIRQTKRIKTKLAEVLPDCLVTFGEKYSWYEITVSKRPTEYSAYETLLQINCGYVGEVSNVDYDLIIGTKERKTGGTLSNNYYFGTDSKYPNCKTDLIKFKKQLENVNCDYKQYVKLHEQIKNFKVPFLTIEVRR